VLFRSGRFNSQDWMVDLVLKKIAAQKAEG